MNTGDTTRISEPGEQDQDAARERAVELGFLSREQADGQFAAYQREGAGANFASFLLERGLLSLQQASDLQPQEALGDSTIVGDIPPADEILGREFSGCMVERKLGQGGMGSVYLCRRRGDDRQVVIKFLAPEQANNRTWRGRFIREADLLRKTPHPNVVEIYSVEAESDRPHIVMEYVQGAPLDQALEERGLFEPLEAARIARDTALALGEAHKNGVIHRDIKPANVLLTDAGVVKMLDFGLAKNVAADDGLSMPGQVLGTPHYMAPEQWGDHAVDARADIFSLGATLYHLVTGALPFPGQNPAAISRKVIEGEFIPPRDLAPECPEDLEFIIFRMLEPDRRYRYPTAKACADDLERVLQGQPVDVPRLVEARTGQRHPLLPGSRFAVGREATNEIALSDGSVSRQHVEIERGKTGYVLRDLGSTYGSYVGGMRIREVVLKDGDQVKLGKVLLEFRDGGLGHVMANTTRRIAPERLVVTTEPEPFMRTLADSGDKRAVVYLLEQLAPDAQDRRLEAVGLGLKPLLGGEMSVSVARQLEPRLKRQRTMLPMQLFSITHENLGDDAEAWLTWWDGARGRYPLQIAPHLPRPQARLRVVKGEPEPRVIPLDDRVMFTVGREERCDVLLHSRSVSRLHATLIRLHTRLVIRDEGSRFGTSLNGARRRMAFLGHGDRLVMGKVELVFEVERPDAAATIGDGDAYAVDSEAWLALEELRHPSVALALVRFLELEANDGWMEAEAARLFPEAGRAGPFVARVRKAYGRRFEQAKALLPELLGGGSDVAAWRELVETRDLPPQLIPAGWFPAAPAE